MIKLKNLWKIALATMAMSAMLVACDTTSGGGSDNGESSEEKKILAPGGEGVYSYTLNVADIAGAWGGNAKAPVFSVVLLTDAQFAACKTAGDFKLAPADAPEYQIAAYDNMKVLSTEDSGNYAIYGANCARRVENISSRQRCRRGYTKGLDGIHGREDCLSMPCKF
jgi:predicted small secreted protein